MKYKTLLFEARDGIARITLNRPEAANSLNADLAIDLMQVALRCDEDSSVRVVVLTGAGNVFCSGGDLKTFNTKGAELPQYMKETTVYLHTAVSRLTRMEAPLIGAVNGVAAGAGLSLVCACDIAISVESARFIMAYTRAGLTPDGSSTYFLPRAIGLKRALELALTNRMLSAKEALDWGIISRVVPDGQLSAEVDALAAQLASGATKAFGAAKRLLHSGWSESLETQMELESRAIADMSRTADGREGISAFVEKRTPRFKGC